MPFLPPNQQRQSTVLSPVQLPHQIHIHTLLTLPAEYAERVLNIGRVSVRPSVCPIDRQQKRRPVGLLLSREQGLKIGPCKPADRRCCCRLTGQTGGWTDVRPIYKKGKGSPYSITERRVQELIPVLGSQPAGDVSHKPGGRLPLLSARPAVTRATLNRAATNFAAW